MNYSIFFNRVTKRFWFKGFKTKTSSIRATIGLEKKTDNELFDTAYSLNQTKKKINTYNKNKYTKNGNR